MQTEAQRSDVLAQGHAAHLCINPLGDQRQINGLYMAITSLISTVPGT